MNDNIYAESTLINMAGGEQSNSGNDEPVFAELPKSNTSSSSVRMSEPDQHGSQQELNQRRNKISKKGDKHEQNQESDKDSQPTIELAAGEEPVPDNQYAFAELPDLQSPAVELSEQDEHGVKKKKVVVLKENKVAITFVIIPMAILGTLIRVGLQRLQTYDGQPVFALVYAQWIGCFIMGMVVQQKDALLQWYLPLHVGLSTGLCGSITTFSSWQLNTFQAFANYFAADHYRGYNILAAISQLLVTLAMSLNGLVFGYHVGQLLSRIPPFLHTYSISEIIPHGYSLHHLNRHDVLVITLGSLSWIGVILAAALTTHQQELTLACVFAPLGALLRWHLSVFNTKLWKGRFFFGTFMANMIGTLVLAIVTLLRSGVVGSTISCQILSAIADGFCGCLTTISTFVVELANLPLKYSYTYGMTSVILGQCFMFLVCGTYIWTQGVNLSCST